MTILLSEILRTGTIDIDDILYVLQPCPFVAQFVERPLPSDLFEIGRNTNGDETRPFQKNPTT